jgi:hypothetical protein
VNTSTNTLPVSEVENLLKSNSRLERYAMAREVHLLICALVLAHKSEHTDFYAQVEICKAYLGQFMWVHDEESWLALGRNPFPKVQLKPSDEEQS